MKKFLFLILVILFFSLQLFSRVPADTNWRDVFKTVWRALPAPEVVFINNTGMYIGGTHIIQNDTVNSLARWNGTNWVGMKDSSGANGINGISYCILGENNNIYVGGYFDSAGSIRAKNVAKWDTSNWQALGNGTNGGVFTMVLHDGNLYVGGRFDSAGNIRAKNIAKWDGSNWYSVGGGTNGYITAMTIKDSILYIGGYFDTVGTIKAKHLAKFNMNSSTWSNIGDFNKEILSLIVNDSGDLYVGGYFDSLSYNNNSMKVNYIAKFNGTNWDSLGSGTDDYVTAMAYADSTLYVGGGFTKAGSDTVNMIAMYRNNSWEPMGSGINDGLFWAMVNSIKVRNDSVFVAGKFSTTGLTYSPNIGVWFDDGSEQPGTLVNTSVELNGIVLNCKPNPFHDNIEISIQTPVPERVSVRIVNILGNEVLTVPQSPSLSENYNFIINTESLENGIYFCEVSSEKHKSIKKLIHIKR